MSSARLHFVGIAGSGMAPLAELAKYRGFAVAGSDTACGDATNRLVNQGIDVVCEHKPENIEGADTVIYSSAIAESNPELVAARTMGLEILHRSDFLCRMMEEKSVVTVSGSHGKTTTTALISHVLKELGTSPTAVFGGSLEGAETSFVPGEGEILIAEADESDGTFLKYSPDIAILTNIGLDHLDHYADEKEITNAFSQHIRRVSDDGCLVIGWDNKICRKLCDDYDGNLLSFGFVLGCDVRCLEYRAERHGIRIRAVVERDLVDYTVPLFGKVNVLNSLACLAACRALNLDVSEAAKKLETFPGVRRRMSVVYEDDRVLVGDDYAHNPDKIAGILHAMRESRPEDKLVAIFQPHRFSRMRTMYDEFCAAFSEADLVIALPVFAAGETSSEEFGVDKIASDIQSSSKTEALGFEDFSECTSWIVDRSKPKEMYLTLGAGDVWRLANTLAKEFKAWGTNEAGRD